MSNCVRCHVGIRDNTYMCPLCHGVIEQESTEGKKVDHFAYPDVAPALRRLRMAIKLTIFGSILAEIILLIVNYLTYGGFNWSLVTGVSLLYGCFTMIYSVRRNKSFRRKIMVQFIIGLFLLLAIDWLMGYEGWSIEVGIPCALLLADVVILVLMIVDSANWTGYIMMMVINLIVSLIFAIPAMTGHVKFVLLTIIEVAVTAVLLLGIVIIGDKKTERELKQRFRV